MLLSIKGPFGPFFISVFVAFLSRFSVFVFLLDAVFGTEV